MGVNVGDGAGVGVDVGVDVGMGVGVGVGGVVLVVLVSWRMSLSGGVLVFARV